MKRYAAVVPEFKQTRHSTIGRSSKSQAYTQFSTAKPPMTQSRATSPRPCVRVFVVETLPAAISESSFIGEARQTPGADDFHVGADRIHFERVKIGGGRVCTEEDVCVRKEGKAYWTAWAMREI
jgi:hypothetical protein